jgi:hypothetical protein
VVLCSKRFSAVASEVAATAQASGPHVSLFGTGGNIVSAIIVAGVILAMLAAVPLLWTNFQASNTTVFALVGIDPMTYIPRIDVLLAFCPLDVMLAHFAIGLGFWLGLVATKWVLIIGIKIIPR